MSRSVSYGALSESVLRVARQLDEATGHCVVCGRPVRLMTLTSLVPPHPGVTGSPCPGGERRSAELRRLVGDA